MLNHITIERCECGAGIYGESFKGKHCNGQRFEQRIFECGGVVQWSPNFERQVWAFPCPGLPECVALREQLDQVCKAIIESVTSIAAEIQDEEHRGHLIKAVADAVNGQKPNRVNGAPWWMKGSI